MTFGIYSNYKNFAVNKVVFLLMLSSLAGVSSNFGDVFEFEVRVIACLNQCSHSVTILTFIQEVTSGWKSVISGYERYQPDIRGLLNGYQKKIDQISIKYLTDFSI